MIEDIEVLYMPDGEKIKGKINFGNIDVGKNVTKILYFRNNNEKLAADISDIRVKDHGWILEGATILQPKETAKMKIIINKLDNPEDENTWPTDMTHFVGTVKWLLSGANFSQKERESLR